MSKAKRKSSSIPQLDLRATLESGEAYRRTGTIAPASRDWQLATLDEKVEGFTIIAFNYLRLGAKQVADMPNRHHNAAKLRQFFNSVKTLPLAGLAPGSDIFDRVALADDQEVKSLFVRQVLGLLVARNRRLAEALLSQIMDECAYNLTRP